jgi:hypothetical protein
VGFLQLFFIGFIFLLVLRDEPIFCTSGATMHVRVLRELGSRLPKVLFQAYG